VLRLTALVFAYAATLAAAPSITQVVNAAAWLPPGLPNSGVAQGAFFTIKGSGLGPSTLVQATTYPLPTTQGLGGTTVKVTVAGVTENCIMYYASAAQVAGILPSATPVGNGTITVTSSTGTASAAITVQAANFGTFTLNQGGSGPAVVTDANYNVLTMINAAHPGDTVILWGTGLGAVSGDETEPPSQTDLQTGVQVFVGNQPATVAYGGRAAFPGEDQINFVVPSGVTGCKTSVAVLVKGVTGNVTTISVAPAGQSICGDTNDDLTAANLQTAVNTGQFTIGNVSLSRVSGLNDILVAGYANFPLASLLASYGGFLGPSVGSCIAYEVTGSVLVVTDPVIPTFLSGGPNLTLTGPQGTKVMPATSTGNYSGTLAVEPSVFLTPGTFTASGGAGGAGVDPFNWSLTLPAPVNPTVPSSVKLSQDLTLTWNGGTAYPIVSIFGFNGVNVSGAENAYVEFICDAQGSAGTFTIPSVIMNLLPPNGDGLPGQPGVNLQVAGVASSTFTVSGSPGLDAGVFSAFIGTGSVAKIVQ
jgi:uncharacterized protein (TIGR03437 family)